MRSKEQSVTPEQNHTRATRKRASGSRKQGNRGCTAARLPGCQAATVPATRHDDCRNNTNKWQQTHPPIEGRQRASGIGHRRNGLCGTLWLYGFGVVGNWLTPGVRKDARMRMSMRMRVSLECSNLPSAILCQSVPDAVQLTVHMDDPPPPPSQDQLLARLLLGFV